jgi:hypothetical protein
MAVCMVVPTLGERLEWLGAALVSLSRQADTVPMTVRVVTPRPENVERVCARYGAEVVLESRKGLSVAINAGWRLGHGTEEALGWLGDDDVLAPGAVESAHRALMADESIGFVYGHARYIDSVGSTLWVQRPTRVAHIFMRYGKNLVPQQGSLFRRSAVETVGGLNESLKSAMDQDLFIRLGLAYKAAYLPRELGAFRLHGGGITEIKGDVGEEEGESVRRRLAPPHYHRLRPVARVVGRIAYPIIRRVPWGPPPAVDGVPYTGVVPALDDGGV